MPKMTFQGRSLFMLVRAMRDAIAEIHNQIATCPDVERFADDLQEYEEEKARYTKLLNRILRKLGMPEENE